MKKNIKDNMTIKENRKSILTVMMMGNKQQLRKYEKKKELHV